MLLISKYYIRCTLLSNDNAGPALVVVLRGLDAFRRLESALIPSQVSGRPQRSLEHILSPTPELAFRLTAIFFSDDELFADNEVRPLLPYLPPLPLLKTTQDQVTCTVSRSR